MKIKKKTTNKTNDTIPYK